MLLGVDQRCGDDTAGRVRVSVVCDTGMAEHDAGRDMRVRMNASASLDGKSRSSVKRSSVHASVAAFGLAPLASQNQPIR